MTLAVNLAQSASNNQTMRNRIINGAMTIDQRNAGASTTITGFSYTLDRYFANASQSSKYTVQRNAGSVTPPAGFSNYLGVTSTSAYSVTSGDYFLFAQGVEGFNFADMAWGTANAQPVTLSFWVRSSLTGTFGGSLQNSASNRSYVFSYTISAANTWEYKTVTIPGDTTGTWVGATNGMGVLVSFNLGMGSTRSTTAGAWAAGEFYAPTGAVSVVGTNGATFYITGVQLEEGTAASPFENRLITTELQLCQRYYWKSQASSAANGNFGMGIANTSTNVDRVIFPLPVTMRATPTVSYSNLRAYDGQVASAVTAIPTNFSTPSIGSCSFTTSSMTLYRAAMIIDNGGTTDFVAFTAEL